MSCSICEKRKEKRFCPAVHGRICPQCCGESREITVTSLDLTGLMDQLDDLLPSGHGAPAQQPA